MQKWEKRKKDCRSSGSNAKRVLTRVLG